MFRFFCWLGLPILFIIFPETEHIHSNLLAGMVTYTNTYFIFRFFSIFLWLSECAMVLIKILHSIWIYFSNVIVVVNTLLTFWIGFFPRKPFVILRINWKLLFFYCFHEKKKRIFWYANKGDATSAHPMNNIIIFFELIFCVYHHLIKYCLTICYYYYYSTMLLI